MPAGIGAGWGTVAVRNIRWSLVFAVRRTVCMRSVVRLLTQMAMGGASRLGEVRGSEMHEL